MLGLQYIFGVTTRGHRQEGGTDAVTEGSKGSCIERLVTLNIGGIPEGREPHRSRARMLLSMLVVLHTSPAEYCEDASMA